MSGTLAASRRIPVELWACFLLGLGVLGLCSSFVTDDALITLRYARMLAEGHGLRFNPDGPPVEGFSNFSHVVLGAAATRLGVGALETVRLVNWLALPGLVWLTHAHARALGCGRILAALAAGTVAVHPALAYWTASGLETTFYSFLLLWGVHLVETSRRRWAAGAVFLVAALTRPEAPAIVLAFPLTLYLHAYLSAEEDDNQLGTMWRRHGGWVSAFVIAYGAYFAWRWSYFDALLPNSVMFKAQASVGGALLREFLYQNLPLVLLALLYPARRLGPRGVLLATIPVVYAVILYDARDSVAYLHRFFLPAFPCLVILAAGAAQHRMIDPGRLGLAPAVAALVFSAGWDLSHPQSGLPRTLQRVEDMNTRARSRVELARWLHRNLEADQSVAMGDVGIVSYALDNPILDTFGLNDRDFIHEHAGVSRTHIRSILRQEPDAIVVVSTDIDEPEGRYATGRRILRSKVLRRHYGPAHRVTSPIEDYHYWVFLRAAPPEPGRSEAEQHETPARLIRELRGEIAKDG